MEKGMNSQKSPKKTVVTRQQAISLLYPLAAFFSSGGMNKAQSLIALAAAFDHLRRSEGKPALEHIGTSTSYLDLIATWSRERRFLDSQGKPRPLRLAGANGFVALVRTTGNRHDAKKMLSVLLRYRNVRKLSDGRVRLVSPLFRSSAGSRIAYEPIAHFLSDATSTVRHLLKTQKGPTYPDLFWRTVESAHVSKAIAQKFMVFAKERSLLFLEELDDWLEVHEKSKKSRTKKQMRVGLGLFSIYSQGT
jgi:Family of unknown function (DUF6502)